MTNSFSTFTLGCKVNQYETQAMAEAWQDLDYKWVAPNEAPGLILVNSCAVTAKAVQDTRKLIRRLGRTNPGARIIATGCAAQLLPGQLAGLVGSEQVVPQRTKDSLLTGPKTPIRQESKGIEYPPFCIRGYARARAVLKVQDGCSRRCTYCVIPYTRGPTVTRPPKDCLAEARRLLESGLRELSVNGINLGQFGRGLDLAWDFWDFLIWLDNQLAPDWAGRARLRLSSLEPAQLNEKGLRALAQCKMLAQHLHVSVQSGSYKVLRRMGRSHYHLDQIQAFLDELKGIWPRFALGGDFLVGFPGELESDLEATYGLIQSLAFTYGHVFPYSPRPQTAAAGLDHQVPAPVKKRRCRLLRQRLAAQKLAFIRSKARQEEVRYVVERYPAQGISGHYLPCREVSGLKPPIGSLVRAKPVGWDQTGLLVKAQDIL